VREPVLAALQQWVLFTGSVVAVGCVAWRLVVAPRAARETGGGDAAALGSIERRVARIGVLTSLVLVGAWMLRLVVQVMGFRDPFVPLWEDVSFLLFDTFWGTVWMAQGVVLVLLAAAFWLARARASSDEDPTTAAARASLPPLAPSWLGATVLVLALVTTLSLSGHAMGVESGRPFIVTADALHALTAGTWIGSLVIILTAGRATRGNRGRLSAYAAQLRSFSPMAVVSVAVLLTMGVVLAWTHLTALSDLWSMTYGRLLAAKTALAGAVLAVGFWNWRRGLPGVDTEPGAGVVQHRAAVEVSLALGVLLLTAILVHSTKP
jgi:putative copper export protein